MVDCEVSLGRAGGDVCNDPTPRSILRKTFEAMLPVVSYGCSMGHSRHWPGKTTRDPILMTSLITASGTWAHHWG